MFGADSYAPHTTQGRHLIAHELTHVIQQRLSGGTTLQRAPDPKALSQLPDPVAASELKGVGFYSVGPDFSAQPAEGDIRRVIVELGIADNATVDACSVREFTVRNGDLRYFAYVHPTLGVVARAGAGYSGGPATGGAKGTKWYSVFAFVSEQDAAKYRPVGGTGELREPAPTLAPMSEASPVSYADLSAKVKLLELHLQELASRYPPADPILGQPVAKALASVHSVRAALVASTSQAQSLDTALQLVEWTRHDLKLIEEQRAKLLSEKAPVDSVDALRARYGAALQKLLAPDALSYQEDAQRYAERLPLDVMLDALRAHGNLNKKHLVDSATLVAWQEDLRKRLDDLYEQRRRLSATPGGGVSSKSIEADAAFLEAGFRGIQLFAQRLVAFEQFIKNRPGVLDTPLIDAMNRLRDRIHKMKAAYDAHDTKQLKERVDALEADEGIKSFYRGLPAAMRVTQMVGRVGVTTLAAIATGGVGGLLAGGARTAASGVITITARGALRFAGTAVLEAVTFTAINAAGSHLLFGDKVTFGSLLRDFAWNLGLFTVMRALSGVSNAALQAAELAAISAPVNLAVGFPFAHGWGLLRFRVEQNRWPTKEELAQMNAESVLMLAGIAVGSGGVQRWLSARQKATAMSLIYREYGWRFQALETIRSDIGTRVKKAEAAGKGNDKAEIEGVRTQAEALEKGFRELLKEILKDKRFNVPKIREELNALRQSAPDVAAELLSDVLGIPPDTGLRRAGRASYTYGNGKTSMLENALAVDRKVTKTTDPKSGLKTVTAKSPNAPDLVFQERAASLDFDTGVYDVQKLMLDLTITSPAAQKMLWRILADEGMATDPNQATRVARQKVKEIAKRASKSPDEALAEMHSRGRIRSVADPGLVKAADALESRGILKSAEWMEARGVDNRRGVVGEWLAQEAVPAGPGARVLRRVTVQADLLEDAAGKTPAKNAEGQDRVGVTAAETDLLYVRDTGGAFEVDTVLNVKASGEKGMAKSATLQNANFQAVLRAKPGDLVKLQLADGVRYARVKAIGALDGATAVDLTGKLKAAPAMTAETVGPKGSGGFSKTLGTDRNAITTIANLLGEQQLIQSGDY